jgi:hypothetical protein
MPNIYKLIVLIELTEIFVKILLFFCEKLEK